jgi:hypothetical protein
MSITVQVRVASWQARRTILCGPNGYLMPGMNFDMDTDGRKEFRGLRRRAHKHKLFYALEVSGTALAAGAWTVDRYSNILTILRCILVVAREEPLASATNRK